VSSGLLQSNKALFKETGAAGAKHLLTTPSPAIKRALQHFLQQQAILKGRLWSYGYPYHKKTVQRLKRVTVPMCYEMYAVYVDNP
jgi:hypothetical protein